MFLQLLFHEVSDDLAKQLVCHFRIACREYRVDDKENQVDDNLLHCIFLPIYRFLYLSTLIIYREYGRKYDLFT